MKIYQVTRRRGVGEHGGYEYYTTKKKAEAEQKKENKESGVDDEIRFLDVSLSTKGVLRALRIFASHPDNG